MTVTGFEKTTWMETVSPIHFVALGVEEVTEVTVGTQDPELSFSVALFV